MAWEYNSKDAVLGLPEGEYEATIDKVEDKVSSKGNDMRAITFRVYEGPRETTIMEHFVKGNNIAVYRMKQVAKAIGKEAEFDANKFDAQNHLGASLTVGVIVEGEYNRIKEFKVLQRSTASRALSTAPMKDDDIPF